MNIIHFKEIDSTNTYAKSNIDNLADKTVISADFQSAGRGRFTRNWVDLGSENIYMTIVLKPPVLLPLHSNLTQYLSVCLCKLLEEEGLKPEIKWPNDVLLSKKKVCGILAESVFKGGKLKGLVLGIGVNLNASQNNLDKIDRPATSVNLELGKNVDKKEFMQRLLDKYFADYDKFLDLGFNFIKEDYEKRASLQQGTGNREQKTDNIKIAIFNNVKEGIFNGFDNDGTLILIMPDGNIEKFNMGEIIE